MTTTVHEPQQQVKETDELSAAELLAVLRQRRDEEHAAAADQLKLAAHWADLHPAGQGHRDAPAVFHLTDLGADAPIAGPGTPTVAEFAVAELGTTLGISTHAPTRLIGHALELRHRLPRLWAAVHAGAVPAWRARLVAETTSHTHPALPLEAARWVDAQITPFAAKVGQAQLDRLVDQAIQRYVQATLPEDPDDPDPPCPDRRHVTLDHHVGYTGTLRLEAELDLADALDLDHTLREAAAALKALGSPDPLDARRALALGQLARHQQALALDFARTTEPSHAAGAVSEPEAPAPAPGKKLPAARRLDLHLHLSAAALTGLTSGGLILEPTARLDEGQRLVLIEHITAWAQQTLTETRILPVLDLHEEITTPGYAPTDRQRRHVELRDQTCYFPWCTRPATGCDLDHVIPYDHDAAAEEREQPGPTATWNLAPGCRTHHRLKTHGGWRVYAPAPGVYLWISPHGQLYLRDRTGTTPIPLPRSTPDRP